MTERPDEDAVAKFASRLSGLTGEETIIVLRWLFTNSVQLHSGRFKQRHYMAVAADYAPLEWQRIYKGGLMGGSAINKSAVFDDMAKRLIRYRVDIAPFKSAILKES